jgi:hypothetical protein
VQKFLTYSGVLIGVYLLVSHATGAGTLITDISGGASKYAKTLQGR